ncbi:hypothetical protein PPROV_000489600 [Pycnococcus provasolii]|uniref:Uncharacterized protein n=1 Tax=Pycnococcus provasolii TaxID=41880 RepID=A0A830HLP4_9CHLO|nr:hypothetical protein PPROV_000489600 [Pycnococcus provasolii]
MEGLDELARAASASTSANGGAEDSGKKETAEKKRIRSTNKSEFVVVARVKYSGSNYDEPFLKLKHASVHTLTKGQDYYKKDRDYVQHYMCLHNKVGCGFKGKLVHVKETDDTHFEFASSAIWKGLKICHNFTLAGLTLICEYIQYTCTCHGKLGIKHKFGFQCTRKCKHVLARALRDGLFTVPPDMKLGVVAKPKSAGGRAKRAGKALEPESSESEEEDDGFSECSSDDSGEDDIE